MEMTLPVKTASNFANSSAGAPGAAHLHAYTTPGFERNKRALTMSARATATTDETLSPIP